MRNLNISTTFSSDTTRSFWTSWPSTNRKKLFKKTIKCLNLYLNSTWMVFHLTIKCLEATIRCLLSTIEFSLLKSQFRKIRSPLLWRQMLFMHRMSLSWVEWQDKGSVDFFSSSYDFDSTFLYLMQLIKFECKN